MNPFVNPKKRSILLPAGCKDLADLLKPRGKRVVAELQVPSAWEPTIKPVRFEKAGLSQVQEQVGGFISSGPLNASLHIRALDGLVGVSLYCSVTEFSIIPIPDTAERTGRIQEFFARRGIQPNFDQVIGGSGIADGGMRLLTFPLPQDVLGATPLTSDLLREVYGIDDAAGLEFTTVNIKAG